MESSALARRQALLGLILVVPVPSIGAWAGLVAAPGPVGQTICALSQVWILLVPALWARLVERQPHRANLSTSGWSVGVVTGVAAAAAIVLFYVFVARHAFDLSAMGPTVAEAGIDSRVKYVAVALYWTFVNALIEEYVWRWFVATRLEVLTPRWVAIVLSAVFFSVHHYVALGAYVAPSAAWVGTFGVFVAAVLWSWLYLRYRSLLSPYVSHVIADAAIFAVGWFVIFG